MNVLPQMSDVQSRSEVSLESCCINNLSIDKQSSFDIDMCERVAYEQLMQTKIMGLPGSDLRAQQVQCTIRARCLEIRLRVQHIFCPECEHDFLTYVKTLCGSTFCENIFFPMFLVEKT